MNCLKWAVKDFKKSLILDGTLHKYNPVLAVSVNGRSETSCSCGKYEWFWYFLNRPYCWMEKKYWLWKKTKLQQLNLLESLEIQYFIHLDWLLDIIVLTWTLWSNVNNLLSTLEKATINGWTSQMTSTVYYSDFKRIELENKLVYYLSEYRS